MPTDDSNSNPEPDSSRTSTDNLLIASAPSSSKIHTVTSEIQQTITHCANRRSNSYVDTKFKCSITSERLAQLKKIVETSSKDHKVFTIKGGWPIIRKELLKRSWLEKIEPAVKQKYTNLDDVTSNLPSKQDWESQQTYVEKCEKMIMSRMMLNYDVDFYWSMRKDQSDLAHRSNAFKLINRFSRALFASKEGLALLLQQSYWYVENGIAAVNFPRTYVLGFPDHYNLFVDDFRLTSCMGLLKWFCDRYEKKLDVSSPDGRIPYSSIQFALDRCNEYIASQKHIDIDKDFVRIWDHEWEQFLTNYYTILHESGLFLDFSEQLATVYANVKSTLRDMQRHWPQFEIDGMKNIWILKPGNKCRGRGIQLVKHIADVDKIMSLKAKYVIQKYIERPLIIYQTKFDIRQWFIVTNVQPLTIWMYRDSYLRFSSQIFNLENFHESLHLTNHAVQCKYTNMQQRDKALPEDNMWDCHTFKAYLKQIGCMEKWNEVIFPGMRQSIICAMLSSQDTMDRRQNTFEIYGADFMVSEDFKPWLLEINCSPDLSFSTTVTSRLCAQCMEDIIKVVIDRRKDHNADTGLFEMVYKQNFPRTPPYLGMNLSVRGRRIFRNKNRSKSEKEKMEKEKVLMRLRKQNIIRNENVGESPLTKILPRLITPDNYKGPVIEDFMEELHKTLNTDHSGSGIDFAEPVLVDSNKKKNDANSKTERVPKYYSAKCKTNHNSIYRKLSSKENIRKNICRTSSGNNYVGFFKKWALKHKIPSDNSRKAYNGKWNKDNSSILKGTNILSKYTDTILETDINKNYINPQCLNAFDLNKLLPHLNADKENTKV